MPVKIKEDALLKGQLKVIDDLQEKIRLLQFDVSNNSKDINILKDKLSRKKQMLTRVKMELEMMKKENNFKNIDNVLFLLRERKDD